MAFFGRDVYQISGPSTKIQFREWNGSAWNDFKNLGGLTPLSPFGVSWGPGNYSAFVRGAANDVYWCNRTFGVWSSWIRLGGRTYYQPLAVSTGPGKLTVFVTGTDNAIWWAKYDNGVWSNGWKSLGGIGGAGITAVVSASNTVTLFGNSATGTQYKVWNGISWSTWQPVPGLPRSRYMKAMSWGAGRIDLLTTDDVGPTGNGQLRHSWFDGSSWFSETLPMNAHHVEAVTWGPDRLDVFARAYDPNSSLIHFYASGP